MHFTAIPSISLLHVLHIGVRTDTHTSADTIRQTDGHTNGQRPTQRQTCTGTDRKMETDKADAPTHAGTHTNTCKESTMDQFTETLRHRDTYGHSETHRLKERQERHIVTQRETYTRKHRHIQTTERCIQDAQRHTCTQEHREIDILRPTHTHRDRARHTWAHRETDRHRVFQFGRRPSIFDTCCCRCRCQRQLVKGRGKKCVGLCCATSCPSPAA